jgi:lysozyme family protein
MTDLVALKAANIRRWNAAKLTRGPEFIPVAKRLVAAKQRYLTVAQKTGIPWVFIAVTHQRESSQNWNRSLAQGDPWNQVSTHVPAGRGPFNSWEDAAYDALVNCPPYASRNKDWSIGGLLTLLEGYNGLGYAGGPAPSIGPNAGKKFPPQASPYIWSGTDQYKYGKYVADHDFRPEAVDQQLGCAGLIMAMMSLDPTISFTGATITQTTTLSPKKPATSTATKAGAGVVIAGTAGTVAVGVQQGWGVTPWLIAAGLAAGFAFVVYLIRKADR